MENYGFLEWPYVGILLAWFVLIVTSLFVRYCTSLPQWIQTGLLGTSGALLASYLTVVIVDKSFRDERARERTQYEKLALRELSEPLRNHLELLSEWYAATCRNEDRFSHSSLEQAFQDDFSSSIANLRFTLDYPRDESINWFEYSQDSIESFRQEVETIQYKYSGLIGSGMAEQTDEVINSQFILLFIDNYSGSSLDTLDEAAIEHLDRHVEEVMSLLEYYEKYDVRGIDAYNNEYLDPDLFTDELISSGIET